MIIALQNPLPFVKKGNIVAGPSLMGENYYEPFFLLMKRDHHFYQKPTITEVKKYIEILILILLPNAIRKLVFFYQLNKNKTIQFEVLVHVPYEIIGLHTC